MTPTWHTTADPRHPTLSRAWSSLLLFVPALIAAMVLGEGVPAWLGYEQPSLDTTPLWVMALAFGAATVILALPLLVVRPLSRRAAQDEGGAGRVPFLVAALLVAGFVLLNLFGLVAQLLAG